MPQRFRLDMPDEWCIIEDEWGFTVLHHGTVLASRDKLEQAFALVCKLFIIDENGNDRFPNEGRRIKNV